MTDPTASVAEGANADPGGPPVATAVSDSTRRRTVRAGFLGSVIEFYDYVIYGFMATILAPQFFPGDDPNAALLSTLAVFGAGYVARPFGAAFFGWFGDRRGRRDALILTVLGMGASTILLGGLPTYAQAGLAGPVLLVVARLGQGFCAGGEVIGATTYIAENSPAKRRGLLLSAAPMGAGLGTALAPFVVGLLGVLLTKEEMASYGWRVAFLIAIPLIAASALLRIGLEDSAEFRRLVATSQVVRFPIVVVFRKHGSAVLTVVLLAVALNALSYLGSTYASLHLTTVGGWSAGATSWTAAVALAAAVPGYLFGGRLTDRFGPRPVLLTGLVAALALGYPFFIEMTALNSVVAVGIVWFIYSFVVNTTLSPAFAIYVSAFPSPVRYSGAAIGFSLGAIVGGGFTPYLTSALRTGTGYVYAPALLVIVAGLLGLAVALWSRSARSSVTELAG